MRTSSTLQMIVPSGMSPTGLMLPMFSVARLPAYRNCKDTEAHHLPEQATLMGTATHEMDMQS